MARGPRYRVPMRRRLTGKTNPKKRRHLLISNKPRMVVRRTSKYIIVQFVSYHPEGDKVLSSATSKELAGLGWKGSGRSLPASYLTGYLAGKRAMERGLDEAILDIGIYTPHPCGRLFGAMNGAVDSGINVPHSGKALPSEDRTRGKHISPETPEIFEKVKSNIDNLDNSEEA